MVSRQNQFDALVRAYSTQLYRYAYWLCRRPDQAEDLVQETFMRAWKALDSLDDDRKAKGWLFTILRREFLRKLDRHKATDEPLDGLLLERQLAANSGPSPGEAMDLRRAVMALPDAYREPLVLQVLGGYSCEEIAKQLALRPGTVMTRLFRARQALKKVLDSEATAGVGKKA